MKWKNANRKELPSDGEQVLISANGIYYLATYTAPEVIFVVTEGEEKITFTVEDHQIYWTEFLEKNNN